jgi:hypothetical protein
MDDRKSFVAIKGHVRLVTNHNEFIVGEMGHNLLD